MKRDLRLESIEEEMVLNEYLDFIVNTYDNVEETFSTNKNLKATILDIKCEGYKLLYKQKQEKQYRLLYVTQ